MSAMPEADAGDFDVTVAEAVLVDTATAEAASSETDAGLFAGRRASYVSPIRLYLSMSILAFALLTFLNSFGEVNVEYTPSPGETVDPAVVERMAEVERTVTTALAVWAPRAMFVLVPLFAAFVMLVRRRGGHTYPQHLYFALHVHAVGFFAIIAPTVVPLFDQTP